MAQRSRQSDRRSTPSLKSRPSVHRVDKPRNQGGQWMSGIPLSASALAIPADADDSTRLHRLVRHDELHTSSGATLPANETAFEKAVRQILSVARWRSQFQPLARTLSERARTSPTNIALVSLADELDAARAILALAMLHGESGLNALVVDGDRHRRTLSILLQHNQAAGLWDAVPAGIPVQSLGIPLAAPGVSFVPAGNRTLDEDSGLVHRALNEHRGTGRLMLLDAGVWPNPDLASYVLASDLTYAVVRCGQTHRRHYRDLVHLLKNSGRTLAGCIVSGSFE